MSQGPVISITIVLYNTAAFVRHCLDSIRKDIDGGFAELIAVDNASPDNSADIIKREFPAATVIHSSVNRGFAGGCNLAWPHVRGKYWLLLNPDTVVPDQAIRELVNWMEKHPEIGVGSPRLMQADGNPVYLSLAFPSVLRALLEVSRLHKLLPMKFRSRLLLVPEWNNDEYSCVDWVAGTALLARRETVAAVGLMSERFFMYCEDVEWCWRIRQAGWKIGVYRMSTILHIGGGSSNRSSGEKEQAQRFARNCYDADRQILGSARAWLIVAIRVVGYLIEYLHPFRSAKAKATARIYLWQNLNVLLGRTCVK